MIGSGGPTLMGARDLRFRVLAWGTALVAVGCVAASWSVEGYAQEWPLLATLAVAVLISEVWAVELPNGGSHSLTYPIGVCGIVLLGPTGAAMVGALSMLPSLFHRQRMSPLKFVFNLGQIMLTFVLPAWAYLALGGRALLARPLSVEDFSTMWLPLLVAATLGILVNVALGGLGYGMIHDLSFDQVWRQAFSWMLASQFALGMLGLAIAQVMSSGGPLGFALFVVPLLVARQTHRRYLSLRETYADTVRSLVAALEAKDQYTKGHSVRVARIAVAVAGQMGFDDVEVERIEYAALLHDLGKIGISRSVLSKPGALTDEEFDKIRQHPDIAARILESVPFLDDVRPIVQDHHERVDGLGYGRGLTGDHMSTAARILAVADGYDAMTAERPYRAAMSEQAAVKELRANAGTQFDPVVVEVLIAALPVLRQADVVPAPEPEGELAHA
jgi:putative nucleotidyltransferase with HDIG domain